MTGPPRQLIESVAEGICWQVLEQHPSVHEVGYGEPELTT